MEKLFKKAVIVGVGLIGGSLASVLKNRGLAKQVVGVGRSKANMEKALQLGIIDEIASAESAAEGADLLFLCGPVQSSIPTLRQMAPLLPDNALISDAGSTKGTIVAGAEQIADVANGRVSFVGSHPIAGTEQSGAEASFETLFDNHNCILTPNKNSSAKAVKNLTHIWETAGMRVIEMTPEKHDMVFGAVSHLPHMVVYGMVNGILKLHSEEEILQFAAGGFKDFTRIASSPPEMWADIALENSKVMEQQIDAVVEQMQNIRQAVTDGDKSKLMKIFARPGEFRKKLTSSEKPNRKA